LQTRPLTFRYVGALVAIAGLLLAGQLVVQSALDRQQGDAGVVNLAGRQRMLSQRLCMLLLAGETAELSRVASEWQASEDALRARGNTDEIHALFTQIDGDQRAMLEAARSGDARGALAHQDAFLAGMDRIVAEYEREARERVVTLRYIEITLFGLALAVLLLEGAFVFRPAVRGLRRYLAQRDRAEEQTVEVSDREQKQLARDLHDGLCQQLVGIAYLVKSSSGERAQLDEIGKLLADAIEQTRSLARGLHSDALDVGGLETALRELAAQTERVYGLKCRIEIGDIAEPSRDACAHLYRIAREAVTNAAKHARAQQVDIALVGQDGALELAVRDDGVGMPARPGDGLGLHMMAYRARMIGAVLEVAAGPSGGTIVTCKMSA
jgi:signal transduction histidine kinase